ncbi:VOC family protein, partial [Klebsiella variicola]|uniref:VOC family protein n=2 Tax=Gammaproteobacteria TaxID=1236 RepID=UPI002757725B|nr:catechol 2,3-dioxygenase [Klebsiella variicola]
MTDTSIDIGPTRHGITHGQTIYFFDPSGNRNEVFCGGDYFYPDHEPITWDADMLGKAIFYHDRQLNERFLTALT